MADAFDGKKGALKNIKYNFTRYTKDSAALSELRGKRVKAIVGVTGSGKSSITNILCGGENFKDSAGRIFAKKPIVYNGQIQFKIG